MGPLPSPSLFAFNIHALPPFLTAIATLFIGLFVVIREKGSRVSLFYIAYTLAVASWMFFASIALSLRSESAAYQWMLLANAGVAMIPPTLYHFSVVVLKAEAKHRRRILFAWAVSAAFLFVDFLPNVLFSGFHHYSWGIYIRFRRPALLFMVYFFVMMVATLRLYWTEYRTSGRNTTRHQRAQAFLIAFGIGYLGALDFLPAIGVAYYPLSSVPLTCMLILVSRAIWRYRLVDITPAFAAQEIIDHMRDALIVLDPDGIIGLVNRATCRMLGVREQDLVGKRPTDGMASCRELAERLESIRRSDAVQNLEVRCRVPAGGYFVFSLSTSIIRNPAQEPTATVCLMNDITQRRKDEEALRASEERLSRAQRMAHVGNWEWDRGTGRLWWSDELYRIYGVDPAVFSPSPESVERAVHPDDLPRYRQAMDAVLHERRSFALNHRLVRPDGTVRSVHTIGEPSQDATDLPVTVSGTVQDVTEQRRADEERERLIAQLQEANRKLQSLDRAKTDFLSVVSHELRTPLTTIKAFVELLLVKPHMPGERKLQMIGTVNEEADRLARMIADLLDLARIESGSVRWQKDELEVGALVRDVIGSMSLLFEKKGLRLTTSFDSGAARILGNRDRLVQVVMNILSNAVKFTPEGGSIRVAVRREIAPRRQVVVEISDTGIGIAGKDLGLIFEKFHRSDESRTIGIEGSGLGLAIAREIVENHGGSIWADSDHGKGSRFTFILPLADATVAASGNA